MSQRIVVVLGWPRGATLHNAVLLSLLLHIGFVVAALTIPGLRGRSELPLPTMDVVLVSPIRQPEPPKPVETPPRSAPAPTPPPPPEPEPEKPPEGPSVVPEDPPEKPVEKPEPTPTPRPQKTAEPKPAAPAPRQPAPSPEVEPTDSLAEQVPDEPTGPISAGAGAALEGMGAEFDWYRDSVIRALYNAWRQPFASGFREPMVVTIAFDIHRDGSVSGVRIAEPSGNSALDRSAYRAVLEAQLPPLPRNNGRNVQPAAFVFQLDPQTR